MITWKSILIYQMQHSLREGLKKWYTLVFYQTFFEPGGESLVNNLKRKNPSRTIKCMYTEEKIFFTVTQQTNPYGRLPAQIYFKSKLKIQISSTRNSGHYMPFFQAPAEGFGSPLGSQWWPLPPPLSLTNIFTQP